MNTHEARKVTCEKVRVSATLGDRNLRIPQGRMCRKKIYSAYRKSLPVATETGVGPDYSLIGCVNHVCQQTVMSGMWVKFSAYLKLLTCCYLGLVGQDDGFGRRGRVRNLQVSPKYSNPFIERSTVLL